jgi:mono/diheme cytochrome c family protein
MLRYERTTRGATIGAAAAVLGLVLFAHGVHGVAQGQQPNAVLQTAAVVPADRATAAATFDRYCVACHNAQLRTAGLVLDPATLADIGPHADTWEKVAGKLRAATMPPPGMPRPDVPVYASVATFLEDALDRAAAERPQLGSAPLAHRLSRTEYANAVRDLLAIDTLPSELDIELLLPADNVTSGFDNIADLLFVSPSTMERYLDAARKISRHAVGDPAMPVMVNIHRLGPEHSQVEQADDLAVGTRGGLAIRSDLPVDGTYVVRVELSGGRDHDLEITVDGARAALHPRDGGGGRGRGGGRGGGAGGLEFPLDLAAGPRTIGVAFVQRTDARDESLLRPRLRSRGPLPAIAAVTISGPYDVTSSGESPSRQRIFVCRPATAAEEPACARDILTTLARRAYRRPATDTDLQDLLPFYEAGRAARDFDHGIQRALERLLVSPQFLFRIERPQPGAGPDTVYAVSDLELASRLSFFLWSSIPDEALLEAAASGRLRDPAELAAQTRRMLDDPRSASLVTNFGAQWLFLRDLDAKRPDELLFQDFDETLRHAMRRETELFLGSVLRDRRSVLDLIAADYTFLNERLARHYGIPGVRGSHFRRVALPDGSARGGLLGQASVLTITSYSTRTSPVLRGKWVLENLLAAAPPPPPPDIPSLATEGDAPERVLTLREAMLRHRALPSCASCHALMDPIGFAMEEFDALGRWRDSDGGQPLDTSGIFPDGTAIDGVAGLKRALLGRPERFVGAVAERLLMYAIGRNVHYYDAPAVRAIVRGAEADGYTFQSLILGVVNSRPFLMRQAGSE